jgi:hypothetical protein
MFIELTSWYWRRQFPPLFDYVIVQIDGIDQKLVDVFSL